MMQRTLFLAMELIMDMMRNIELEEKEAELAKEEASRGGMDILKKVEDLKPVLEHAKEANNIVIIFYCWFGEIMVMKFSSICKS